MKNIEEYKFERFDLVIATAVKSYLKNLTPEARKETLEGLVRKDGAETMIDGSALTQLIESAKAAALISSQAWKPGEGNYQKALAYIREQLPAVNSEEYAKNPPREFLHFLEDCVEQ